MSSERWLGLGVLNRESTELISWGLDFVSKNSRATMDGLERCSLWSRIVCKCAWAPLTNHDFGKISKLSDVSGFFWAHECCLKINKNVALDFCLFHLSCPNKKLTYLEKLYDGKFQVFKNSPKLTISGIFKELLSTHCKRSSFRSQCWNAECDFFCDFQTLYDKKMNLLAVQACQ